MEETGHQLVGIASAPDPPKARTHIDIVDVGENTQDSNPSAAPSHLATRGRKRKKKEPDFDIGPQRPLSPPKPDPQGVVPGSACARAVVAAARWYRYSPGADKSVVVVGRSTCGDLMWVGRAVPTSQACRMVQTRAATWCSSFGLSVVEIHAAGGRPAGVGSANATEIGFAWGGTSQRAAAGGEAAKQFFLARCSLAHDGHTLSLARLPARTHSRFADETPIDGENWVLRCSLP